MEFHHSFLACSLAPLHTGASHNIKPLLFPKLTRTLSLESLASTHQIDRTILSPQRCSESGLAKVPRTIQDYRRFSATRSCHECTPALSLSKAHHRQDHRSQKERCRSGSSTSTSRVTRHSVVNHCQQSISVVSFQQVAGHWALFCFGFLSEHEGHWAHRAPHERRDFRRCCTRRTNPWASTWPNHQFHYSVKHRSFQVSASQHCSLNCIPHSTDQCRAPSSLAECLRGLRCRSSCHAVPLVVPRLFALSE